jgi:hypothetical protein
VRNLIEHPITGNEIESCLLELSDEILNGPVLRVGDMRPILLQAAALIVCRSNTATVPLDDLRGYPLPPPAPGRNAPV